MTWKAAGLALLRRQQEHYEIFLLRRPDGVWEFPGGGREKSDKTPEETANREFYEETGVKQKTMEQATAYYIGEIVNQRYHTFVYLLPKMSDIRSITAETLSKMDLDEHDDLNWYKLSKLPKNTHPGVVEVCKRIKRKLWM